jgi:ATP-binding cassette subfamily B protein
VTEWRAQLQRHMNDVDNKAIGRAVDSLLNYETVKYFGAEEREAKRYDEAIAAFARATVRNEVSLAWLNIGQALITNLMMAGAMIFTVWGWSQGRFTPGDVVFINTMLLQLFRPLDMLGWVYRSIRQGLIDMEAMWDLLDTPAEVVDKPGAPPLKVNRGQVRFENVRFGYESGRDILKGLDLEILAGTSCAIVGSSGAGKSTIARLLYRFYDPSAGRITIDGQDIADVNQRSLRAAIGIVPQDTVLFNDTIGYNIGYGRDGAGDAEIEGAARGAAIDRFIASLPDKYESMVGERGLKLSGGEKQRVAIARTLLKNPPILVLDEATSALDSRTEQAIQETLDRVAESRTTIMIAHRLSTIVNADQIVVLDEGHVAERGTHEELLDRGGLYADLWYRQAAEQLLEETAQAAE